MVAPEIKVKGGTPWPDYVFNKDYNIMSLVSLEAFIQKNELGAMNAKLLEKIEELTLYVITMNKKVEKLNEEVQQLKNENKPLKNK